MISKVAKVFDEFIQEMGGNIDPRSNNNKTRVALHKFWITIQQLQVHGGASTGHIQRCMEAILHHKLTCSNFTSDDKYRVYDYLGNEIEDSGELPKENTSGV
jgi:hypothetical protein